mmetsp:Transcript_12985/g.31317  ORF Transcript_12985/g.31317 Transcript_12985/m.31317 type:complete len:87 (+) Transcript_12985:581-841(+)
MLRWCNISLNQTERTSTQSLIALAIYKETRNQQLRRLPPVRFVTGERSCTIHFSLLVEPGTPALFVTCFKQQALNPTLEESDHPRP